MVKYTAPVCAESITTAYNWHQLWRPSTKDSVRQDEMGAEASYATSSFASDPIIHHSVCKKCIEEVCRQGTDEGDLVLDVASTVACVVGARWQVGSSACRPSTTQSPKTNSPKELNNSPPQSQTVMQNRRHMIETTITRLTFSIAATSPRKVMDNSTVENTTDFGEIVQPIGRHIDQHPPTSSSTSCEA